MVGGGWQNVMIRLGLHGKTLDQMAAVLADKFVKKSMQNILLAVLADPCVQARRGMRETIGGSEWPLPA